MRQRGESARWKQTVPGPIAKISQDDFTLEYLI